jgi:hypothetical protein
MILLGFLVMNQHVNANYADNVKKTTKNKDVAARTKHDIYYYYIDANYM